MSRRCISPAYPLHSPIDMGVQLCDHTIWPALRAAPTGTGHVPQTETTHMTQVIQFPPRFIPPRVPPLPKQVAMPCRRAPHWALVAMAAALLVAWAAALGIAYSQIQNW